MLRTKLWLIVAVAMIVGGVVLLSVAELVYMPRIQAYSSAVAGWSRNFMGSNAPTLEEYGLDPVSMAMGSVLGVASALLLIIGLILLVIAIVVRVISRTRIEITLTPKW